MEQESLTLGIEGMTCVRCGEAVQRGLLEIRGVLEAVVDWEAGSAVVAYNSELVCADDIVKASVFSQERVVKSDQQAIRHKYAAAVHR